MPWNFIDPIFFPKKKQVDLINKNGVLTGIVLRYTFSNTIVVKIHISNQYRLYYFKLRKYSIVDDIESLHNNDNNCNDNKPWKIYNNRENINNVLKGKTVHINNISLGENNTLIGDVYLEGTLINYIISKKTSKNVTFL